MTPIYEFTIERRTTLVGSTFAFDSDVASARARQSETQAGDMTATIRAATAADAIQAFEAATGERERAVTQNDYRQDRSKVIARVSVTVTGMAQVTP